MTSKGKDYATVATSRFLHLVLAVVRTKTQAYMGLIWHFPQRVKVNP